MTLYPWNLVLEKTIKVKSGDTFLIYTKLTLNYREARIFEQIEILPKHLKKKYFFKLKIYIECRKIYTNKTVSEISISEFWLVNSLNHEHRKTGI